MRFPERQGSAPVLNRQYLKNMDGVKEVTHPI
jgi:hypothetical protein